MPVLITCLVCKKIFKVKPSRLLKGVKYCSRDCYWKEVGKIISKAIDKKGRRVVLTKCKYCNEEFSSFISLKRVYCSKKCANDDRKGNKPWNFGIPMSSVTKTKLSTSLMGKIPWNKGKKYPQFGGKNHFAWKGGTYNKDRKIDMQRKFYREWRKSVLERDNYTCIWCGSKKKLNADHIKPYSLYPELRYELSNGRTLCEECHKKTDTYGKKAVIINHVNKND